MRLRRARNWGKGPELFDCLCLGVIAFASALPYLPRLDFYSDDWGLLVSFQSAVHSGTLASVAHNFIARPVQGAYLATLFKLFGLHPLSYHLVNTAVLAAGVCLYYLLLFRLRIGRPKPFASAVLLLMLPQLSTVRVWYSASQITLSLALMLVSMHAQLSFSRTGKAVWLALAIGAAILCRRVRNFRSAARRLCGGSRALLVAKRAPGFPDEMVGGAVVCRRGGPHSRSDRLQGAPQRPSRPDRGPEPLHWRTAPADPARL